MPRKNSFAKGRLHEKVVRDWIAGGGYDGKKYHCEVMPTVKWGQQDFWGGAYDIQCANKDRIILAQVKWQSKRLPPKTKAITDKMEKIDMPSNVSKILVRIDGRTGEKIVDVIG